MFTISTLANPLDSIEFQLRQILDNSTAVVYVKDCDGRYLLINRAFQKLFNCSADEVLGQDDKVLFAPEVANHLSINDRLIRDTAEPREFEETLLLDGRRRVYLSNKFPLFTAAGEVYGVCGISTDITQRKQMEDALCGVALGVSAASTEDVFDAIVEHIVSTLNVDFAFVSRLQVRNGADAVDTRPDEMKLETLAVGTPEGRHPNMVYSVSGTPCEQVIGQCFYMVPGNFKKLYPRDGMAVDFDLESYAGYPLFSSSGKPLGLVAIAHSQPLPDRIVTESMLKIFAVRAAAELERLDAEASYRVIFDASEDSIFVLDMHTGRIIDANPKACQAYGHDHTEMLALDVEKLSAGYSPYAGREARKWLSLAAAGEPQRFEWHRRNRHGDLFWDEVQMRRATIGGVDRVLAFTRDITSRKLAEDALRASERQHRAIVSTALDCIISIDLEGRILGFNPAAEQCFGLKQSEAVGFDFAELIIPSRFCTAYRAEMQNSITNHSGLFLGRRVEITAQRANGEEFPAELAVSEVIQENGPFLIAYLRDITERHQAEIERSNLEQQLRRAQRLEAIGQLTGGIAHDFNNLLTSILGYTGMALNRSANLDDEKLGSYLTQVQRAGDRARELILQMLTFSRGGRGHPQRVDVRELSESFIPLLRSMLPDSVVVSINIAAHLPAIMMDPVQLEQILMNLCVNASSAMADSGNLTINVRSSSIDRTICSSCLQCFCGEHLLITVADTGSGISDEIRARMFEPFYSSKETGKGSGMGLSIVHGIVHECGGHICVDTEQGQGSSFKIYLPPSAAVLSADGKKRLPSQQSRCSLYGKVAVVDDEALVAEFMVEQLREWGLDVTDFRDPLVARDSLLENINTWDFVILDQIMPGMQGLELAKLLLQARPELKVLIYTGYSDQLDDTKVFESGVKALLRKPVDDTRLYQILARSLA